MDLEVQDDNYNRTLFNKITWLNANQDGVGGTKHVIEFSRLFKNKKIIHFKSNFANYSNSKNFSLSDFEVIETVNIFDELKNEKIIYIGSFPNDKNTIEEIDLFYSQLEELHNANIILAAFLVFNNAQYINHQTKILLGLNFIDYIFVFNSKDGDYAKEIKKWLPYKQDRIFDFAHPYTPQVKEKIKDKENSCVYIGRFASFKSPEMMIELMLSNTFDTEFECYGIGRTIESLDFINNPDCSYLSYKNSNQLDKINIRGIAPNDQMLGYLRKSMFAFSGYHLKANNYGSKSDFVIAEMMDNQCICILHTHFLENVYLNGKKLIDYNFCLSYDGTNAKQVSEQMKMLYTNQEERESLLERQKTVLNEFYNPFKRVHEVVTKITSKDTKTMNKEQLMSFLLVSNSEVKNIAFDPSDLKRKDVRVYVRSKGRIRREIL